MEPVNAARKRGLLRCDPSDQARKERGAGGVALSPDGEAVLPAWTTLYLNGPIDYSVE